MIRIKVNCSYSSGLDSFFDKGISSIGLDDGKLGEGGFGSVYCVDRINKGKSPLPLVVKILHPGKERNFETVVRLQRLVRQEAQELLEQDIVFFDKYPSLLALPLLSFEGTLEGKTVYGYLSYDLLKLDFVSSDYIFLNCLTKNPEVWLKFQRRNLSVKYKMAHGLAVSCAFLRRIHFIHADITPDNLFIHPYEPLCVLIDYDSGAIIDSKSDFPTTEGKHYADWTPPEMAADDIAPSNAPGVSKRMSDGTPAGKRLTAAVDDWAFTIALHYIFTGYQAFFTKDMYPRTIELLDEMYRDGSTEWPDIKDDPKYTALFGEDSLKSIPGYREYYDRLDDQVKRGFAYTFSRGALNLAFRHDARWWIPVLERSIRNSPFKPEVKWRTASELRSDFPNVQSKREDEVPKAWCDRMHFSKDHISVETPKPGPVMTPASITASKPDPDYLDMFDELMKELVPEFIQGTQKLRTHRPIIERYAGLAGLDGGKIIKNLEDLLQMYKEMLDEKSGGQGLSRSDRSLLICQARLAHVDISGII